MTRDGGGGGDLFDGMSHEQMLQWLDQADSGTVQAAADRLAAAAKAIHKIAGDLKARPQYVSWKGEGAEAFRTWGSDLANSTIRLGDFSASSAQWLGQAAEAIAGAQAAIPREVPGADGSGGSGGSGAKGGSGTKPSGKPASKSASKSAADAAALAANREAVRQEAAGQMRKLGQSYRLSATQMDGLERPVFPPVPGAVAPSGADDKASQDLARPGDSAEPGAVSGSTSGSVVRQHGSVSDNIATPHPRTELPADRQSLHEVRQIGTDLDSVDAVPKTPHQAPPLPDGPSRPEGLPVTGRTDSNVPLAPHTLGQGPGQSAPTARGRVPSEGPIKGGRIPPRQVAGGVPQQTTSKTPTGGAQNPTRGIVGGRPTQTPTGRAATGISRSPVVGGKGTQKNTPSVGRTGGTTNTPASRPARPSAQKPGRPKALPPTAVPSRGETPARGLPPQTTGGVIGSQTTKQESSGRLPSGASAPTRGGIAGGVPSKEKRTGTGSASTPAQPDASSSSHHGEQSQPQQPRKPEQPQRHITTEPQKKSRPQAD
jgi:hypothetical protein